MSRKLYLLLALWAVLLSALVIWFSRDKVKHFDPNNVLANAIMSTQFDKQFAELISNRQVLTQQLIFFTGNDCFCEALSQSHIDKLTKQAKTNAFVVTHLDIKNTPLKTIIPSTPAAAVFDANGELAYLGPISKGAFCTASSGIIESIIVDGFVNKLPGAVVMTDSSGCYCQTS